MWAGFPNPAVKNLVFTAKKDDFERSADLRGRAVGEKPVEIVSPTGRPSQPGEWTWELAVLYPRQGEWPEDLYLNREFEEMVEYIDGKLEFIDPLYPPDEAPPESHRGDWTWEMLTEFPRQGMWEVRHLDLLPDDVRANVKLVNGCLEFPPPQEWIALISPSPTPPVSPA